MTKITPFLWFDHHAEEAARFYVSLFKNSRIVSASPMVVNFELNGQSFAALNGGPRFRFTEAVSFVVNYLAREEKITHFQSFVIILGVAIVKATLVGAYFMHLVVDWRKLYYLLIPAFILGTMMMIVLLPDIVLAWR